MAFRRSSFAFLSKEEEQRKEEIRQRKAAAKQQKREEKMQEEVKDLKSSMRVSQEILKCLKKSLNVKTFNDKELKLYISTLKWMAEKTEDMKAQLFNITGEASYLIDIDSLYAGIRQIQEKRSSEAGS